MKFKIVWNNDIRIFSTASNDWDEIFPAVRKFVAQSFGVHEFNATYIDDEDEKITISRASDLQDALQRYAKLRKIPKIYVSTLQSQVSGSFATADGSLAVSGPRLGLSYLNDDFVTQQLQYQRQRQTDAKAATQKPDAAAAQWVVEPSHSAMGTVNKIRQIVDQIDMSALPKDKEFISIAIGDPTKYPNLQPSNNVTKTVQNKLLSQTCNGYTISYGARNARASLAKKYSMPHIQCTQDDVVITSGCSDALNLSICALLNKGDNFLIPRPGFSFYETLASRYGFEVKFYDLLPEQEWQIDTQHLRSQIDKRTKAILINNPSNPCGSVLTEDGILRVLQIAENYSIPIVADEIYAGMIYDDNHGKDKFVSVASLTRRVPVLTLSGLSKLYLTPGWRAGWIVIHDPIGAMVKIRTSLQKLSTVLLGSNTLIQESIPAIIEETPESYYDELNDKLLRQSSLLYREFDEIEALQPIRARGAMYLMVKIDMSKFNGRIKDDIQFANLLLKEQGVLCLPGAIFNMPNYFRAVICPPPHIIAEIGKRVKEFCHKYCDGNASLPAKL
eukprot:CAMPEP_0202692054 /NCGR_PEP_ID=MMETSP1385-20130828/6546_1 /ASSEMBLY_ACC=CAM_ASM_000861 /TAXON_ID=933848 /ORGANISM="Elphidium margaritaceum" /LENGTH=558 /DNA_ID=CAMNT_0049347527 /DNA_START=45 /DNA_END=1721 /DNA_ORIENTATION=+